MYVYLPNTLSKLKAWIVLYDWSYGISCSWAWVLNCLGLHEKEDR